MPEEQHRRRRIDRCVVVGSINTDFFFAVQQPPSPGESVLGTSFSMSFGGKGANQAVQAALMGIQTTFVGRIGTDVFSGMNFDDLRDKNVNVDCVFVDETYGIGKGLVVLDETGENQIIVVPEANWRWSEAEIERATPVVAAASIAVFQLEIPVSVVVRLASVARDAGATVVLNPSPVPPDGAPGDLLQLVDVLVLNATEATALTGIPVTDCESSVPAARELVSKGVGAVVTTLGSAGSVFFDGEEAVRGRAFSVNAVDPTGAGDAFCAAFACSYSSPSDAADALTFANAAGALATTRKGARTGLATREEIVRFIQRERTQ